MLTQNACNSVIDAGKLNQLKLDLNRLQPVNVGEYIANLPFSERAIAFRLLNKSQAIAVFEYLPNEVQQELINSLHDVQVAQIVEAMNPDERAELFEELPAGVVRWLLQELSPEQHQAAAIILGYSEGTAGRVMTTQYIRLGESLTVRQALHRIRHQDKEAVDCAYVIDNNRRLVSVISIQQLLFTHPDVKIRDIASQRLIKVKTDTPQLEVGAIMKRHKLLTIPVVDCEDRLVGIVNYEDVVNLQEQPTVKTQKPASVNRHDKEALAAPLHSLRKRIPWLLGLITN